MCGPVGWGIPPGFSCHGTVLGTGSRAAWDITTVIKLAGDFYYAEVYHQQYLYKQPGASCGLKGAGVTCLITP